MVKPDSLLAHLMQALPGFKQNPDGLVMFADEGNAIASATGSLSFEYAYKLNIILTDYAGDANAVMVPLLAWIAVHQRDLMDNPDKRKTGIRFEIDFNNKDSIDLSIVLDLTERVIVKEGAPGQLHIVHKGEPQMVPIEVGKHWTLRAGDQLLAQWISPAL